MRTTNIQEEENGIISDKKKIIEIRMRIARYAKRIKYEERKGYYKQYPQWKRSIQNSIEFEKGSIEFYKRNISFHKFLIEQDKKGLELRWVPKENKEVA